MTASLYQSALSGSAGAASGTATTWLLSRNTEDVRRQRVRVELHEVAPAAPGVMAPRDEIVEHVAAARRAIEIDGARLHGPRVEVHADENQVFALLLRVADELVVVAGMEAQAPVALQCRIGLSYFVQPANQLSQIAGAVPIPALDLVFFRI